MHGVKRESDASKKPASPFGQAGRSLLGSAAVGGAPCGSPTPVRPDSAGDDEEDWRRMRAALKSGRGTGQDDGQRNGSKLAAMRGSPLPSPSGGQLQPGGEAACGGLLAGPLPALLPGPLSVERSLSSNSPAGPLSLDRKLSANGPAAALSLDRTLSANGPAAALSMERSLSTNSQGRTPAGGLSQVAVPVKAMHHVRLQCAEREAAYLDKMRNRTRDAEPDMYESVIKFLEMNNLSRGYALGLAANGMEDLSQLLLSQEGDLQAAIEACCMDAMDEILFKEALQNARGTSFGNS